MESAFRRAIANVTQHGDTDIFPFPIENRILFDQETNIIAILNSIDSDFENYIVKTPPENFGALAPVGYTGFRWATQIDPIWNVYFLAVVISIAAKIEAVRLDTAYVHSYRFNSAEDSADLFDRKFGWHSFTSRAIELAEKYKFVVSCDISEFYPRLNHHRLDNALRQLPNADSYRYKIMHFLSNYSGTYSFGLPVGGPAARTLAELTLNQIDRLVHQKQIPFCRFADDFYLFADSESEAFKCLVFLSDILHRNQGLQLQKSKTRIMSSAEFIATNPISIANTNISPPGDLASARQSLFKLSLYYDPYSANAEEHYERLREEIGKFPILDIIRSELSKSRVDISLARRIISALQFMEGEGLNDAARTLADNHQLLYPVYYNVMSALKSVFSRLSLDTQNYIIGLVRSLIEIGSSTVSVDINLQYAIRLLSETRAEETVSLLSRIFDTTRNLAIRRDIILVMAKWNEWIWLSDKRSQFRIMQPAERRAFIIGSYALKDEGKHWREHTKAEFSPFEIVTRDWISERIGRAGWELPI